MHSPFYTEEEAFHLQQSIRAGTQRPCLPDDLEAAKPRLKEMSREELIALAEKYTRRGSPVPFFTGSKQKLSAMQAGAAAFLERFPDEEKERQAAAAIKAAFYVPYLREDLISADQTEITQIQHNYFREKHPLTTEEKATFRRTYNQWAIATRGYRNNRLTVDADLGVKEKTSEEAYAAAVMQLITGRGFLATPQRGGGGSNYFSAYNEEKEIVLDVRVADHANTSKLVLHGYMEGSNVDINLAPGADIPEILLGRLKGDEGPSRRKIEEQFKSDRQKTLFAQELENIRAAIKAGKKIVMKNDKPEFWAYVFREMSPKRKVAFCP